MPLDEESKAEILELIKGNNAELLSQVDRKNSGLATSISKDLKRSLEEFRSAIEPTQQQSTQSAETGDPEQPNKRTTTKDVDLRTKALETQLQELRTALEQEKQQKLVSDRNATLTSLISGAGVIPATQNAVRDIISARYGASMEFQDGQWYVKNGDSVVAIDAVVQDYLKTPEGMAFLPPSGTKGAGSSESGKTLSAAAKAELSIDELYALVDS